MAAGYSVSMFTDWRGHASTRSGSSAAPTATARPSPDPDLVRRRPPRPAARTRSPACRRRSCTAQLGVPGPWHERLPHFRPDFTPSAGDELQTRVPVARRARGRGAARAARRSGDRIAPLLQICEIRTIAADDLWLSPAYRQDSVAFHFTWRPDSRRCARCCPAIEAALAPFGPRPHWGKLFTMPPADLHASYDRLPDFLDLAPASTPRASSATPTPGASCSVGNRRGRDPAPEPDAARSRRRAPDGRVITDPEAGTPTRPSPCDGITPWESRRAAAPARIRRTRRSRRGSRDPMSPAPIDGVVDPTSVAGHRRRRQTTSFRHRDCPSLRFVIRRFLGIPLTRREVGPGG